MTSLFQSAFDLEVQEDSSLKDFDSVGYRAIAIAAQKLCQGVLPEVFIYGKKGLGKTHLALAIYNEYVKTGKSALNLSLGQLIHDEGDDASVLIGLDNFDLVILDDLHDVAKSREWQEGLFHLINLMRAKQKQLVFLANNPARELNLDLLDLLTRLSLAPAFKMPDGDNPLDRKGVLNAILRRKNWRLPPLVFDHLVNAGPYSAKDMLIVLDSISPLLKELGKPNVSKKVFENACQIIDKVTLQLEINDYMTDIE